ELRTPLPLNLVKNKPRHIIVRFLRDKAKMSVLAAARKKKQIIWKGMRCYGPTISWGFFSLFLFFFLNCVLFCCSF
uniref:L1 transposable element RRM domain-containing protein n=1 Tax=Oreochromis niloticus TaxID=8128 RepID=A0A669BSQ7_ORENI